MKFQVKSGTDDVPDILFSKIDHLPEIFQQIFDEDALFQFANQSNFNIWFTEIDGLLGFAFENFSGISLNGVGEVWYGFKSKLGDSLIQVSSRIWSHMRAKKIQRDLDFKPIVTIND